MWNKTVAAAAEGESLSRETVDRQWTDAGFYVLYVIVVLLCPKVTVIPSFMKYPFAYV